MNKENRRTFLRQFGLTVGALTVGVGDGAAFFYQKKAGIRQGPDAPATVDFRNSPAQWHSPVRYPGASAQTFIGRGGSVLRPGDGADAGSVELFVTGAGDPATFRQSCEEPHLPFVQTSIAYGESTVGITAFSSSGEDEGVVDNITIATEPPGAPASLRFVVKASATLTAEIENNDDLPNGAVCVVTRSDDPDRPFLILNARPDVTREGDALVLTLPAVASVTLRMPAGKADTGDITDGIHRIPELGAAERARWTAWKAARGPAGWDLPGAYGAFALAGARILDQMSPAPDAVKKEPTPPGPRPDLVDEHFISEAEMYLGREKEARSRLEAVWNLEDAQGQLIGAGGAANVKEMCAAVYSLCRHAELTGDWTMFGELYPDAFNALDSLKDARDRAAAMTDKSPHAVRNLLPEGSPGTGWPGIRQELTNTIWALIALKQMLDISDRQFLLKKSQIRDFYRELLVSFNTAARETMRTDPAGFSWFPVIGAGMQPGAPQDAPANEPAMLPQAGLGTLSLALSPGNLYKKDDKMFAGYAALVKSSLVNGVPAGTGPGGAGSVAPVDAAVVAQALTWFSLPEDARSIFIGCLNHASPVYTWTPAQGPTSGPQRPVDLRATAESLRFLRHALVLEDAEVLRLFEGIAAADLAGGKSWRIENTPTRWGRVSVALEPVDARTWKATYRREPVNPDKGPLLKGVEMPRVLGPNFRFDTISPGSAIKNGPRVLIDAESLRWEAYLRDLRRTTGNQ
jgi:hypothetical protein